ncbi:hypothetical protein KY362_00510 [Candidatus Woesearchaeota archaeon]|nr:hypothetical protein [Candidatus Woesearchaeota archaeon]
MSDARNAAYLTAIERATRPQMERMVEANQAHKSNMWDGDAFRRDAFYKDYKHPN